MGRCTKRRYRHRLDAELALDLLRSQGKVGHDEQRVYRCNQCRRWHLTSQPPRPPTGAEPDRPST